MFLTPWKRRRAPRALLQMPVPALLVTFALVGAAAGPVSADPSTVETAPAAQGGAGEFQKFTLVRSAGGRTEQLAEIALRTLGDRGRDREILALNRGRVEPDGGVVTDPPRLRSGWVLSLPYDAYGEGVRYGLPPTGRPPSAEPARRDGTCVTPSGRQVPGLPWAQLRLTPEAAWSRAKGTGVTVAVLDSGVSADVAALSGRVLAGSDERRSVTSAAGGVRPGADSDCDGHGTALAGIVAAAPQPGGSFVGVAPAARILPIRLSGAAGRADPAELASGLRAAAVGGSAVALVGYPVDLKNPQVQTALRLAVAADVTVVLPAPAAAGGASVPPGVLRVGAVGPDGRLTQAYAPGSVDVVAPGTDVVTLARAGGGQVRGNGTEFAAAFVAGTAALVCAAEPRLSPAEVAARIQTSAERRSAAATSAPDPEYGFGLVDIPAAVRALPPPPRSAVTGPNGTVAAVTVVVFGVATLAFGLRRRRR